MSDNKSTRREVQRSHWFQVENWLVRSGAPGKIFRRNYDNMIEANTIDADKYFHCMANCEASQRGAIGRATARAISDVRELTDVIRKGDSFDDVAADQRANRTGREGGANNPDQPCTNTCQTHRPRGLDERH
jgi:hypothetical protein